MISEPLHAWVLHKRTIGDTSAQVTFFTREKGLVCASFKGGRTPKKQALLQAFTPLWLSLDATRDWHFVRHIEALSPSLTLSNECLFSGLYVNELLYNALTPLEPSAVLYDAYVHTLNSLTIATQRLTLEVILRRFEWQLLHVCGYQISLTEDAYTGVSIEADKYYTFIPGDGLVNSQKGILGVHIIAFAQDSFEDMGALKAAKWIMRRAIDHALEGTPIKSRALFQG